VPSVATVTAPVLLAYAVDGVCVATMGLSPRHKIGGVFGVCAATMGVPSRHKSGGGCWYDGTPRSPPEVCATPSPRGGRLVDSDIALKGQFSFALGTCACPTWRSGAPRDSRVCGVGAVLQRYTLGVLQYICIGRWTPLITIVLGTWVACSLPCSGHGWWLWRTVRRVCCRTRSRSTCRLCVRWAKITNLRDHVNSRRRTTAAYMHAHKAHNLTKTFVSRGQLGSPVPLASRTEVLGE
jgi:hypothetical protein